MPKIAVFRALNSSNLAKTNHRLKTNSLNIFFHFVIIIFQNIKCLFLISIIIYQALSIPTFLKNRMISSWEAKISQDPGGHSVVIIRHSFHHFGRLLKIPLLVFFTPPRCLIGMKASLCTGSCFTEKERFVVGCFPFCSFSGVRQLSVLRFS